VEKDSLTVSRRFCSEMIWETRLSGFTAATNVAAEKGSFAGVAIVVEEVEVEVVELRVEWARLDCLEAGWVEVLRRLEEVEERLAGGRRDEVDVDSGSEGEEEEPPSFSSWSLWFSSPSEEEEVGLMSLAAAAAADLRRVVRRGGEGGGGIGSSALDIRGESVEEGRDGS
jgi:hypothetical protein